MNLTHDFEAERPRLVAVASRLLGDHAEAEDIVQVAWLRLDRLSAEGRAAIQSLPAWLTTVTTRLCLDRLKARTPAPMADDELHLHTDESAVRTRGSAPSAPSDPADHIALADTVGLALQVVLDRLTPSERVAFVLHDSFGFEFTTIAAVLDTSPAAARKLASRARAKVAQPAPDDALATWEVVDAFMAAARGGDFDRLLSLLAPDAAVRADAAAVAAGTPTAIDGATAIATFFNGSAQATLPVFIGDRPGSAWFHRGSAKVLFDFEIDDGLVTQVTFRADPDMLAHVARRSRDQRR